jgi:hypothetical protein
LRLGNVTTLRWRDVDLKNQVVKVVDIKSPDVLEIPIVSPFLINLLGELRRKSPKATPESFLFPEYAAIYNADDAAPLSAAFRDILVAAGLSEKYQKKKSRCWPLMPPGSQPVKFAIAPAKDKAAPRVPVTPPAPAAARNRVLQMN